MITGYNTDVRHREVVFHVQTEDKGTANPMVESLVYVGGQVVASHRASYSDLLADGKGQKAVVALMDRQHRTMIAAVKGGRFDAKVPELAERPDAPAPPTDGVPVPEAGEDTAFRRAATERTLDQVILEYLTSEAEQEQLLLALEEGDDVGLGRAARMVLRATSSKSGNAVAGAQVLVKMISTVDEPHTLAVGTTDGAGRLRLAFDIPSLDRGTAALIISAASALGRAELKQLL
jgi:hypothetical protein